MYVGYIVSLLAGSLSCTCFHTRNALNGWLISRVVSVLNSGAEGPGFKSQSRRRRLTVLGKLFTPIIGSSPLKGCGGDYRPGGK